MAQSRVRSNRKLYSKKIKPPKWSTGKRITLIFFGVVLSVLAILAIAGAAIRYYRLISK